MKFFGRNFGKRKELTRLELLARIETADRVIAKLVQETLYCGPCSHESFFCAAHRVRFDAAERVLGNLWTEVDYRKVNL